MHDHPVAKLLAGGSPLEGAAPDAPVYVVDDDDIMRASLAFHLLTLGRHCRPFAGATPFLETVATLDPGLILLDIRMAGLDGVQTMAELDRRGVDWPVVIMTGHADVATAVTVMKRGAIELLEKPFTEQALIEALARAAAKLARDGAAATVRRVARERFARLTDRERDVLALLVEGRPNKIVAHLLGMSVRTVEMHRANLLAKLGVRSIVEAAALAPDHIA